MRDRWERTGAITRLLMAIFGNLSRRAWLAYSAQPLRPVQPRIAVVARRPKERSSFVPRLTAAWQAVAARALPTLAQARGQRADGAELPVVWLDASERPDIADLPRVLGSGRETPVLATQWLADLESSRCFLIITFAEPVAASWAVAFTLPEALPLLELTASTALLVVALDRPPSQLGAGPLPRVAEPDARHTLWLPLASAMQLRAILASWHASHR